MCSLTARRSADILLILNRAQAFNMILFGMFEELRWGESPWAPAKPPHVAHASLDIRPLDCWTRLSLACSAGARSPAALSTSSRRGTLSKRASPKEHRRGDLGRELLPGAVRVVRGAGIPTE